MKFCSFASGSDGNCYYIGTDTCGILIDAGISIKTIKKNLKQLGISLSSIYAVFVTHDHYDHIASVGTLGEVYNIPIYSTQAILEGINRCYKVSDKLYQSKHVQELGTTINIANISITSFHVNHDSTQCVGYYVESEGDNLVVATDLGYINDEAIPFLLKSNNLVIETNYDEEMLLQGSYPLFLKKRILGNYGHLANHVTARFLAENHQDHWKHIFFCHLSKENNSADAVLKMLSEQYDTCGIKSEERPELTILPRTTPIDLCII